MVYKAAHVDPGDGKQYHVRYIPASDPKRHYWTSVNDSLRYAERIAASYRKDPDYSDVRIFVREVTPWREMEVADVPLHPEAPTV